jgi:hypothetical protein
MLTYYNGNLHGDVEVGHVFVISGKTIDGASEFSIDLAGGKPENVDIPFHMSVRFHQDCIVRNSVVEEQWGAEEIFENLFSSANPIISGWDFKIYILVGDEKFHVSINEQPFCFYNFRAPLDTIKTLRIHGELQKIFQIDHRRIFPSPWPYLQEDTRRGYDISADFPRAILPGHVIVIQAIPAGNPSGTFMIKMNQGSTKRQMFHLRAKFLNRITILNCMNENQEWRRDEEQGPFPFIIDQLFKMAIAFTETSFEIAVDGEKCMSFPYRYSNSFLDNLMGLKFQTSNGTQLEIQSIDHMNMGISDCEGFETYSHPDVIIN